MATDPYDKMIADYPNLYRFVSYIECGPGWFDLLNTLSKELEKLIVEMGLPEPCRSSASQVKEKYGSLRFYMSSTTKKMDSLIEKAENLSYYICENCGHKDEISNENGCYTGLCTECGEKIWRK